MIELYLSTDGKHTIHLQTVSQEEMDKLFPYAKQLYQKIVDELGTKAQMWHDAINSNGNGVKKNGLVKVNNAPMCSIHKTHMQLRSGKYGEFWSCGTKLLNGSWCRETSSEINSNAQKSLAI
ncbi:MAG: hypothetical protein PHE48_02865 [Candidatus Daviesbacteria bacterium]|nr:hypothetical protein [Candidatus Daviesbacteria bacterium]